MDQTSPREIREILLRHGKWIGSTAFAKLIAGKRKVTERQAKTDIRKALDKNQIIRHVFSDLTVIYGLDEFGPPTNVLATREEETADPESIRKALEELRSEYCFFKEPTVKEVACIVGKKPKIVEAILYALAPGTGWKEPDEVSESDAKKAINLAGWLSWKEKGAQDAKLEELANEIISGASKDQLRRAQLIMKNCPSLIPKVSLLQIDWPHETEVTWRRIFDSEAPSPFWWIKGKGFIPIQEMHRLPEYRELYRIF